MKSKIVKPKEEHQVAYSDLVQLIGKHGGEVTHEEYLAIAANVVGKLLAMQDQKTMTKERAVEIIKTNIEQGNLEAIAEAKKAEGSA